MMWTQTGYDSKKSRETEEYHTSLKLNPEFTFELEDFYSYEYDANDMYEYDSNYKWNYTGTFAKFGK